LFGWHRCFPFIVVPGSFVLPFRSAESAPFTPDFCFFNHATYSVVSRVFPFLFANSLRFLFQAFFVLVFGERTQLPSPPSRWSFAAQHFSRLSGALAAEVRSLTAGYYADSACRATPFRYVLQLWFPRSVLRQMSLFEYGVVISLTCLQSTFGTLVTFPVFFPRARSARFFAHGSDVH